MKRTSITVFCLFFLCLGTALLAGNPFDLQYRLQQDSLIGDSGFVLDQGNPFELQARPQERSGLPDVASVRAFLAQKQTVVPPSIQMKQIRMAATVGMLLMLTLMVTLFRGLFVKAYSGFFNDNLMFQFYREQEGRGVTPIWLLYLLFPVNLGLFVFYLLHYFSISVFISPWGQLGVSLLVAFTLLFLKQLVLRLIARLFLMERDMNRYVFLILVFGTVMGVFLVPVNVLIAYGPASMHKGLVLGTLFLLGGSYVFRGLRGVMIANKFLISHKFHFLLYICAVEILPVLLFVKVITA